MTKANLTRQLNKLLAAGICIGLIFLVIIAPMIFLISKRISRPLKKLTEGVNMIGAGGEVKTIPVESVDEIGKLAQAFNQMAESLKIRETENQTLSKQLHLVQKMEAIGTMAGGIAHDFNNILSAIMGYTELAMLETPQEGCQQKKLKEVFKASLRAKDLVNQILTFSRQVPGEPKPYKLAVIIKEALKMLRASIPSSIEIRQNIASNLSPVMTDPTPYSSGDHESVRQCSPCHERKRRTAESQPGGCNHQCEKGVAESGFPTRKISETDRGRCRTRDTAGNHGPDL
jgi:hypothetical protein